jgi:hypothetical protein
VDEQPCDPLTLHAYGARHDGSAQVHLGNGTVVDVQWQVDSSGGVEVVSTGAPGAVDVVVHEGADQGSG